MWRWKRCDYFFDMAVWLEWKITGHLPHQARDDAVNYKFQLGSKSRNSWKKFNQSVLLLSAHRAWPSPLYPCACATQCHACQLDNVHHLSLSNERSASLPEAVSSVSVVWAIYRQCPAERTSDNILRAIRLQKTGGQSTKWQMCTPRVWHKEYGWTSPSSHFLV